MKAYDYAGRTIMKDWGEQSSLNFYRYKNPIIKQFLTIFLLQTK